MPRPKPRKPTDTVNLTIRIRELLRQKLERAAIRHDVSLNSEIVDRLEQSFSDRSTEALVGMLIEGPKESARLLTLLAGALQLCGGWKSDADMRERLETALPLFVKDCVDGRLTPDDTDVAPGSQAGRLMALTLSNPHEVLFKPLEEKKP
jgi:hypothetical protein